MEEQKISFDRDVQELLIAYMLRDDQAFTKSQNILNPEHFHQALRPAVTYLLDYANDYRTLPELAQIKAMTGVDILDVFGAAPAPQHQEWYYKNVEEFARFKAAEAIILKGPDLLASGKFGEIQSRIKEAAEISLMRDMGLDYFADPMARLQRMKDRSSYVSTGWASLDAKLLGGFTRGGLNIFAGGSGSGKSLFLQNIAINWAAMGMHVVYMTLELDTDLVSLRLDAMISGLPTKMIFTNMEEVALRIRTTGLTPSADGKRGSLILKKFNQGGTCANDLRAFLKEYEIQTGHKPDAICVDYLDLLSPNNRKIDPSDLFVKDKYTSEELRGLCGELDLLCATASQLNRASVEATDFDHSHIAGGVSKINTADNVFGIFTTATMKEQGFYEIQFLKTRSSSAVGSKLRLLYDPNCMRIMDLDVPASVTRPLANESLRQQIKQATQNTVMPRPGHDDDANDPPAEEVSGVDAVMKLIRNNRAGDGRS